MNYRRLIDLGRFRFAAGLLTGVLAWSASVPVVRGDTVITDFNASATGSRNPRENWLGFGGGTTDDGVHSSGSVGNGAYHTVDWSASTWGVGELYQAAIDLSPYTDIRIDARFVGLVSHSGTARLRFALDVPGNGEWTTPSVALTSAYQTYTFSFADLSGSGSLDLTNSTLKWVVEKNGQSGTGRFDFDEVVAVGGGGGPFVLTPVVLNPPPDGDAVRAMWFYSASSFASASASQAILDFCGREGVNRLNLGAFSVWANGSAELKDNLRAFVTAAHASGIRVEALLDGTDWQDNPALVRTRIDEILAFQNATAEVTDDFDALHFDIEFWLDPSWTGAPDEATRKQIARNYFDNVLVNARDHLAANGAAGMAIAVDLSAHFETSGMLPAPFSYNGTTQRFVEHTLDLVDDLVLMSYIDSASGLLSWTGFELDLAAGKGRAIQLGADIQFVPPEQSINSFADNAPTAFAAMTAALDAFHSLLTPTRAAALDGFSIFHYDGYLAFEPSPRNRADQDGDGDADLDDYDALATFLRGPTASATGLARDLDFDLDNDVDLFDFAFFARCFTGAGVTSPVADECLR